MKNIFKILTPNKILVVIGLSLSFAGMSWASLNYYPQNQGSQAVTHDTLSDRFESHSNDSLAKILYDHIPPYFIDLDPKPGQKDVSRNSVIKFTVCDTLADDISKSGVDTSSIYITIESRLWGVQKVRPDTIVILDPELYFVSCVYHPRNLFDWSDTVSVYLEASDLSSRTDPNRGDTSYTFYTVRDTISPEPDKIPPLISIIHPKPDTIDVPINTEIVLYVTDDSSGVNTSSVELKVNGEIILNKDINFITYGTGDTIIYEPSSPFAYKSEVKVDFFVADSASNAADTSYSFWTEDSPVVVDLNPPIVFDHYPGIYNSINTLDCSINFKITDDLSGVNKQSISVSYAVNKGHFTLLGYQADGSDTVTVICNHLTFNYNDTVFVKIYAEDKQGNHTDTSGQDSTVYYYFIVPQDLEPPRVVLIEPTQLESTQDSFVVRIEDDISGVDVDKLEMYLWSRKKPDQHKIDLSTYIKFNDLKNVEIEYWPSDPYEYNDILSLKFFLQDKCGNSTTVTLLDTIYTPKLLTDLFVLNLISSAGEKPVKVNSIVSLDGYIICVNENCPDSFAVCFYFDEDEQPFKTGWVNGLNKDEVHVLNTSHVIPSEGKHEVTAIVDCIPINGRILEENEFNNTAEVLIFGEGAKLIVRSNPFTPNDDGFNDDAEFNFEQFDVENPNLKIFDMHGKKVREFDIPHNKRFIWNGSDSNRTPLLPGIYLYIFSDRDKAIARGCIVIAR